MAERLLCAVDKDPIPTDVRDRVSAVVFLDRAVLAREVLFRVGENPIVVGAAPDRQPPGAKPCR